MYLKFPQREVAHNKNAHIIEIHAIKIHTHFKLLPVALRFCLRFVKFEAFDNHGKVMVEQLQTRF